MEDSFYFKGGGSVYEVIPEEDKSFTIFKDGVEYLLLTEKNGKWLRIDYKTDELIIEENEEVEAIGRLIRRFLDK